MLENQTQKKVGDDAEAEVMAVLKLDNCQYCGAMFLVQF